ncbi:MAG TPA: SMP-30/gluconolactonase/LRE family protein [Puia sp.]|jgi:sugar lactone lactonase YvrE|nr:SMP-30/gluconolactonase/LRE family protein [Puia sp.]
MTKFATAELIYQTEVICGESPVWDEVSQRLYWADVVNGNIYIFNPIDGSNKTCKTGQVLGSITLCERGGLLLSCAKGFFFLDPDTGKMEPVIDREILSAGHYFADGKCDPKGRFWAGTYQQDITEAIGVLYSLENDLSVKKRAEKFILSNGLAWNIAKSKFYFIDSIAKCVYRFDYDSISGDLTNQQIVTKISGDTILPDGMTIDTEGFLWIALFNAGKVIRIDPMTGETNFEVLVPSAKQVTSCTFGGKDFDELYITTARELEGPYGIPEDDLRFQDNAGGLFKAKLPFKGLPAVRFKG